MGVLLNVLALWVAAGVGTALLWIAVKSGLPRTVSPAALPSVSLPQPRPEHVDVCDSAPPSASYVGASTESALARQ